MPRPRLLPLWAVAVLLAAGCTSLPGGGVPQAPANLSPTPGAGLGDDVPWRLPLKAIFDTSQGTFVAELASEMAPRTVANFANLSRSGFYDGTRFHRIVVGVDIQGGDPNTRSGPRSTWGYGGPGYTIPDELHPLLRHDRPGMLSMATSGPNTGGSQFFISLGPVPSYDDRYTVFGRVVEGMNVVHALAAEPVEGGGTFGVPVDPGLIRHVTITPPASSAPPLRDVAVRPVLPGATAAAGIAASVPVIVHNRGNALDTFRVSATGPAGWNVSLDATMVEIPAQQGAVVLVSIVPGVDAGGTVAVRAVSVASSAIASSASIPVSIIPRGATPRQGDLVQANYVGLLPDGRIFDTTWPAVDQDPNLIRVGAAPRGSRPLEPYSVVVGSGATIAGFDQLVARAPAGTTSAARIPGTAGYVDQGFPKDALDHRDLVFVVETSAGHA